MKDTECCSIRVSEHRYGCWLPSWAGDKEEQTRTSQHSSDVFKRVPCLWEPSLQTWEGLVVKIFMHEIGQPVRCE